ncbi:sigma-70 family RNA polymerase sigma factor [Curtobacterium flaccumfaciens]|uniref:sigma-70 family RNA polymerase sigma factor n=1 Tax=Curtobacterium flaccumfaciens TaxID=2035 RepID=UPI001602DC5A|nr:sigma-70 family RNA polymerase sigma factor [Curtobacterium flaccumfaciens]MBB1198685.1 sigma-70 family RNA polymerase sigma factor [Curtobacterium flaccumfaciens]
MPHTYVAQNAAAAAFTAAYRQHAPGLHRFVATIIIDRHLAEDVVHEAFVELWQHPDRRDPDRADLQSWLRTIAHRRAIDRIRSVEASRRRDVRIGIREHHSVDQSSEQFDALFTRTSLRTAFAGLSDKQRDAVVLRYLGEHTVPEVACILGTTVGAAKTRVRDGLLELRGQLLPDTATP